MTTEKLTQEQMIEESHALIESADPVELMMEAQDAVEPGSPVGEVIHRPDAETPFGIVLDDVESAGYKIVYHTVTREPSVVNANMLESQLSKMVDITDGEGVVRRIRAFTTRDPSTWVPPAPPPFRGTLLCVFHKDGEMYDHYNSIGIFPLPTESGTCRKHNLVRLQDVRRHAEHRHKDEWAAVEMDRTQAIETEEREIRLLQVEDLRAQRLAREGSVAAPEPPVQVAEAVTAPSEPPADWKASSGTCWQCSDFVNKAPKAASRRNAYYRHKSAKH